jgi:putative nucleotidyltransferase with HDIG domain
MKIETAFFRSKVARRIFILFGSCALIPLVVLVIISLPLLNKRLKDQSFDKLDNTNNIIGNAVVERLSLLKTELEMVASKLREGALNPLDLNNTTFVSNEHFQSRVLITDTGETEPFIGLAQNIPELSQKDKEDIILSGKPLLSTEYHSGSPPNVFMGMPVDAENPKQGFLLAEVNIDYVLSVSPDEPKNTLPEIEFCLLDQHENLMYSTLTGPISFPEKTKLRMTSAPQEQEKIKDLSLNNQEQKKIKEISLYNFEWSHEHKDYLSNFRQIFLGGNFHTKNSLYWISVVSEGKADVFKLIFGKANIDFGLVFLGIIFLTLWVVMLLSYSQILRSMVPLESLKEGTKRIARKEFSSRVIVKSHDEFEEVAESFNSMASQLGRHFKTLTTVAEIDRAVLSVLDREKVVDTVLNRMREVFPCDGVSVTMIDSKSAERAQTYLRDRKVEQERLAETVEIKAQDIQNLYDNPTTLKLDLGEGWPGYLSGLAKRGSKSFLILPIFIKQELAGIVSLGYLQAPQLTQDDLDQARQLADQVAVAFSNVRLIEELDRLNWGTLRALARAIDAKSSWTAGHSERGTRLALQIGEKMGLSKEEIDDLHRGGLLHDIGKIGISPEILDKPGKLTDEERQIMNGHVTMGARILEPIAAYAKIIPIVLQHHECFDGSGYPDGLAGEAIDFGARIFALADRFEALTSERPYRKALHHKRAAQYIKKRAGTEFDPKVVKAFLEFMAEEEGIKV